MSNILIKRAAIFTLLTFTLMVLLANYSFAQPVASDELKEAEEFFENGDYDNALKLVDKFIAAYSRNKEELKDEFCRTYLVKAKIYYDTDRLELMTIALRNLFDINVDYTFQKEDPDFIKEAEKIRKIFILEKEEKERIAKEEEEKGIQLEEAAKEKKETQIAKEGKKKKKFPVLLVLGGAAVIGAAIYFLTKKKSEKEFTLNVSKGEGVDGTPVSAQTYKKGTAVSYNYSLQDGFKDLVVKLDDQPAAASGSITMDRNHTLSASATRLPNRYTLTVTKGLGVNGTPESGSYTYYEGTPVNYSYNLQTGYQDIQVKMDGNPVSASGTITMNSDHILTANAAIIGDNPPTVEITNPANGATITGSVTINATVMDDRGIDKVEFYIDDSMINSRAGSPYYTQWNTSTYSNGSHKIKVIAYDTKNQKGEKEITVTVNNPGPTIYELEVIIGNGAEGTPPSGKHAYSAGTEIHYQYNAKTGYTISSIKLDGNEVPTVGTILMDKDHSLVITTNPASL